MKLLLALITLFFFSTQIIPAKYLIYKYNKISAIAEDCKENDDDETDSPEKNKEKINEDIKILAHNFPVLTTYYNPILKYYRYNVTLKSNHALNVLTPPPLS